MSYSIETPEFRALLDALSWASTDSPRTVFDAKFDELVSHINAHTAAQVAASKSAVPPYYPDLAAIINWLEGGCDPQEAVKELRYHQKRINEAKQTATGEKGGAA